MRFEKFERFERFERLNDNPLRTKKAEWLVTAPSFLWLAVFFVIPVVIVLAFTFHGHDASGGVGEWSMSTWRELVDPDYPAIVWNTLRISFEITVWSILLALPCAYAIARMNSKWRSIVFHAKTLTTKLVQNGSMIDPATMPRHLELIRAIA